MNHGGYGATLFDPRWKAKRKEILARDRNSCVICSSEKNLQVHHRQYHFSRALNAFRNPWEYPNNLLVTLCERCHQRGHRLYKVPTKYLK
jgi:5-methylcytosine-specific restriction endonuclease McrA